MLRSLRFHLLAALAAGLIASAAAAQPGALPRWPALEGGGAYALFLDNNVTIVNGTPRDYARGKALRKTPAEQLFWFERGGKEYVVRDDATLKALAKIFLPQLALGKQAATLNGQQARIGQDQESLNAQFEQLGVQQAEFGERMAQLAAEQVRIQEAGEDTSSVEAEMQGLEQEQMMFEGPQAELSRQQEEINRRQELLQRQQEDLGRQQEQATLEAERQLKSLVAQALVKETAKPVK
jgi:hypothetical protein